MQQNDGTMKMLTEAEAAAIRDRATPEERTLMPLFTVGELLEIRGGKFRIVTLDADCMRLRGVPWSTTK
jgi:hypothetical protein